ncbi:ATPase/histidine kinase/DNA gyrase B/HSP90 domain protein [delta proteobacterium NaphS2]|nr:ATPase/histidine kinase/DNA gyrase B/HSP90 domain protein [delta proteobacterium NaphS2]
MLRRLWIFVVFPGQCPYLAWIAHLKKGCCPIPTERKSYMGPVQEKSNGHYHALRRNILLTIIIVSITPMILVSISILYQFNVSYREKVEAHLKTLVKKHKQNIDSFLKEKSGDIASLAKTFTFAEMSDESFLKDRLAVLQQEYDPAFVDLGVINARGVQMAYAGPFNLGKAVYSSAEWFKKAMESDKVYVSDVFLGIRGLPHFIVAVRDNWNGEPWILRATIDFVAFNDLVENIRIGETGFAFILNSEGEFQTKPLHNIIPSKEPYAGFLKNEAELQDKITLIEREDASGIDEIYVAAFLKGGRWLLVYQQRAADAFTDLRNAFRVTLAIILLGSIGIISMAYIHSKKMVSRIVRMDKEKQIMNTQIVETGKLASIGELAAGIAHEINNPVAIMVEEAGWIEDLLSEEDIKESENLEEFKRALQQIHVQGKRCKEITHKLLSFARKSGSTVQDVQINELLREVISLSEQRAKYSNVVINKSLEENLPTIRVSESELQQVFLNLINNALDAMEKTGGNIAISTKIVSGHGGQNIQIQVADEGTGIPESDLIRIFDPFYTTKPVGKGTGLGLSICYGIVKQLGGDIEVKSAIGEGARFIIRIPLDEEEKK